MSPTSLVHNNPRAASCGELLAGSSKSVSLWIYPPRTGYHLGDDGSAGVAGPFFLIASPADKESGRSHRDRPLVQFKACLQALTV
ncbi:MAG: hypothetical protein OXD46_05195 [Chloroflexi bacterium]|nr:hypothetical protein [Chloroflexota bacterium]